MFLGEDLPSWLVLAFGAALAVGNIAALVMPQSGSSTSETAASDGATPTDGSSETDDERIQRPPLMRSLVMIALGTAASVWAIASLLS